MSPDPRLPLNLQRSEKETAERNFCLGLQTALRIIEESKDLPEALRKVAEYLENRGSR